MDPYDPAQGATVSSSGDSGRGGLAAAFWGLAWLWAANILVSSQWTIWSQCQYAIPSDTRWGRGNSPWPISRLIVDSLIRVRCVTSAMSSQSFSGPSIVLAAMTHLRQPLLDGADVFVRGAAVRLAPVTAAVDPPRAGTAPPARRIFPD